MSSRSGAIRQPADDGSSFDLSKRSPEQIAQLFARWKEQRKRLARDAEREPGPDAAEQKSAAPQVVRFTPAARALAQPEPEPQPADTREEAPGIRHYSADFSAIRTSDDRATAHRVKRLKFPAAVVTAPARPAHGSGMRWTLAIAVSFIALTAAAGAAYWSQQAVPVVRPPAAVAVAAPVQPEPVVEQPLETQTAAPFLPAATRLPEAEPWSTALLVDPASGLPSVVEVAQEPLSANHKSIQTTSSTASGPAPSIPMAEASAEAPGDFVTSAGGSSPTAEAVHEAAPPTRQAANSAERGNQRDRLRLDPGSASGSTIDRNGSAAASRSAQGENDPSGNGTASGSDVGSSANAGSNGGATASGSDASSGSADGGGSSSSASSDVGGAASSGADNSAGGTGTSDNSSSDGNATGAAGGLGNTGGADVSGAVGGIGDAVGGELGGVGKPEGIGKPDGKGLGGKGANASGKGKGKDKSKDKDKDKGKKGGGKGGGHGKG
jgi:hypothetical protein